MSDRHESVVINLDQALPEVFELGIANSIVCSGSCAHADRLAKIEVNLGGAYRELTTLDRGRRNDRWVTEFFSIVDVADDKPEGRYGVRFRITFEGGRHVEVVVANIEIVRRASRDVKIAVEPNVSTPMIAICMATYNPERQALERQLQSIIDQTYRHWICIVCDDGSDCEYQQLLADCCSSDSRIYLVSHPNNVNFYRNFERALSYVPESVEYIALADQDDRWYPEKLKTLVNSFDAETLLVYSDMRIVDHNGDELLPTYWGQRRNNYERLDLLLLANTVTGAACIFRSSLLPVILPFPMRIGDAFHDHWIACVALSLGRIAYVDESLYDYYQHRSSVIGHCDFEPPTLMSRVTVWWSGIRKITSGTRVKQRLITIYNASLAVYRFECLRLRLMTHLIARRCPTLSTHTKQALQMYTGGVACGLRLLAFHSKVVLKGYTTDDAELRLGMGFLVAAVDQWRYGKSIVRKRR